MTINDIENYFRQAINRFQGGLIIQSGISQGHPYILLDSDLIDSETKEPLPPVMIRYPESIPAFALKNSQYMSKVMKAVNSVAPWGDARDCEYIRDMLT